MVEIQFSAVGIGQPHPSTIEGPEKELQIQFGTVSTIAGGFVGAAHPAPLGKDILGASTWLLTYRLARNHPSLSFLDQRSQT